MIARARDAVAAGVNLEALLQARVARENFPAPPHLRVCRAPDVAIAVARDAAFGFYYPDDLNALAQAGASVVFFDALREKNLPACDGLLIGGGFPETSAAALSANKNLREDIRAALAGGLPCYAECGGMMYLSRSITFNGETHAMVGALPADAVMGARRKARDSCASTHARLSLGNVSGPDHRRARIPLRPHGNVDPAMRYAWKVRRGYGIDGFRDGMVVGNTLWVLRICATLRGCAGPKVSVNFVRAQKHWRGANPRNCSPEFVKGGGPVSINLKAVTSPPPQAAIWSSATTGAAISPHTWPARTASN